jgi:hypothetical protein
MQACEMFYIYPFNDTASASISTREEVKVHNRYTAHRDDEMFEFKNILPTEFRNCAMHMKMSGS